MHEAAVYEFPFVEAMPERKQGKVAKVWSLMRELRAATEREGALVPVMLAAKCLDISRTRIDQLVTEGRLRRVAVDGHVFITEDSIVKLAKVNREWGKHLPQSVCDAVRLTREYVSQGGEGAVKKG